MVRRPGPLHGSAQASQLQRGGRSPESTSELPPSARRPKLGRFEKGLPKILAISSRVFPQRFQVGLSVHDRPTTYPVCLSLKPDFHPLVGSAEPSRPRANPNQLSGPNSPMRQDRLGAPR